MQPSENYSQQKNAAVRITSVFLELLERQFPIESVQRSLELKTAQDFAKQLSVHVNYLNSAVKEITGKTTTAHLSDRIIIEAKALLQHTAGILLTLLMPLVLNILPTSTTSLKRKLAISPNQREQFIFEIYTFSFVFHYFCLLSKVTFAF